MSSAGQSIGLSEMEVAWGRKRNVPRPSKTPSTDGLVSKENDAQQRLTNCVHFLTVGDCIHILDETVDRFENLQCGRPSLSLCESVWSLACGLNTPLFKTFLQKPRCVLLSNMPHR